MSVKSMDATTVLMAANAILLMPVYFILRHLLTSISGMRLDVTKLSNDHHYLRGRLDQHLPEIKS